MTDDAFPDVMVHTVSGPIAQVPYWVLRTILAEALRSKKLDCAAENAVRNLANHLVRSVNS